MRQEKEHQDYISIDFSFIIRKLWQNVFVIIMCACIAGVVSYVFLDNYQKDTYTSSVNLTVIARDNSAGKVVNVGTAVTRCLNVLNSDMLKDQINKSNVEGKLSGDIKAVAVSKSNIITLQATSTSAESSFRLLESALEAYPSLSSYFESGYLVKTLDSISVENITVSHPKKAFYALSAAGRVFLAGIGLTVCMCLFTDKLHNKEQAESILDLDIVGVLHYIKKKEGQKAILVSDKETDISYSEEIDKLTTHIRKRMDAHNKKILMVNSVGENEGKSTIAANIGLSLARRNKSVLYIDADLRRPALYKIFEQEVDEQKQFSSYLNGDLKLDDVIRQDVNNSNIKFILQSKAIGDPDRMLESDRFDQLLSEVKRKVDYIIIDTPPMGIVRDAEIIAEHSEEILIVMKQDNVRGSAVNDIIDMFDDTKADILGGVMTMVKGKESSGSHKGHYGKYYYGYGYERG